MQDFWDTNSKVQAWAFNAGLLLEINSASDIDPANGLGN